MKVAHGTVPLRMYLRRSAGEFTFGAGDVTAFGVGERENNRESQLIFGTVTPYIFSVCFVGLTTGAQPRAAQAQGFALALRAVRLVGCSALLAGAVFMRTLLPGRRAGTPCSIPSALRSSSTSGQ